MRNNNQQTAAVVEPQAPAMSPAEELRDAIRSLPIWKARAEHLAKLRELSEQNDELIREWHRLEADLRSQSDVSDHAVEQAEDLIRTGELRPALPTLRDELNAVSRKKQVVELAMKTIQRRLHATNIDLDRQAAKLLRQRQPQLVTRTASALQELKAVDVAEQELIAALTAEGVSPVHIFGSRVVFHPITTDGGHFGLWFDARRREGFEV